MPLVCVGLSHQCCLTLIFGVPWHFQHCLSVLCAISAFFGVAAGLFLGRSVLFWYFIAIYEHHVFRFFCCEIYR